MPDLSANGRARIGCFDNTNHNADISLKQRRGDGKHCKGAMMQEVGRREEKYGHWLVMVWLLAVFGCLSGEDESSAGTDDDTVDRE